jgi:hypothetical protein
MVPCTEDLCPRAEAIPARGHHGDDDRASVLVTSPLEGQLINRAPFYWSGGLGTLIRKSALPEKKDLLWDFFVYTNSPATSSRDVASYSNSWLDSWRFSQLGPDNYYDDAGWSSTAFQEHKAIQEWGLSSRSNGAFNMRLPGAEKYTRAVLGNEFTLFLKGESSIEEMKRNVYDEWGSFSASKGTLNQLDIYRASLGLEIHTEFESCSLNRELMDEMDPSVCRKYDADESNNGVLIGVLLAGLTIVFAVVTFVVADQSRRKTLRDHLEDDGKDKCIYRIVYSQSRCMIRAHILTLCYCALSVLSIEFGERDEIIEVERLIDQDNRRVSLARVVLVVVSISATVAMTLWANYIAEDELDVDQDSKIYIYVLPAVFFLLLLLFLLYDWLVRRRTTKLVVNAAKTSEIVTAMFPGQFRVRVLAQTRVMKKEAIDSDCFGRVVSRCDDLHGRYLRLYRLVVATRTTSGF